MAVVREPAPAVQAQVVEVADVHVASHLGGLLVVEDELGHGQGVKDAHQEDHPAKQLASHRHVVSEPRQTDERHNTEGFLIPSEGTGVTGLP